MQPIAWVDIMVAWRARQCVSSFLFQSKKYRYFVKIWWLLDILLKTHTQIYHNWSERKSQPRESRAVTALQCYSCESVYLRICIIIRCTIISTTINMHITHIGGWQIKWIATCSTMLMIICTTVFRSNFIFFYLFIIWIYHQYILYLKHNKV